MDAPRRLCIVYDCLHPWTVGGAERWLRRLAEAAAADGWDVTYLTRRQWEDGDEPAVPGVRVVAVGGRRRPLYDEAGRRAVLPPLLFGGGVLLHLLRHRRSYDAVHLCSFPFFSLLAARLALAGRPVAIGVDWFEVWSRAYWRGYLGAAGGAVGWVVQAACARVTPLAFTFSERHARRLRRQRRGPEVPVAGFGVTPAVFLPPRAPADPPYALFLGRHTADKQVTAIPAAVAEARRRVPGLRAVVAGDGPSRADVAAEVARLGLEDVVELPGFVDDAALPGLLAGAACLVNPSRREGFGLVVLEACGAGVPAVVVDEEDNAAADLVAEGVNGALAPSAAPADLGAAIARAVEGGPGLRAASLRWAEEAAGAAAEPAEAQVLGRYAELLAGRG